jgi:hypothetical protein
MEIRTTGFKIALNILFFLSALIPLSVLSGCGNSTSSTADATQDDANAANDTTSSSSFTKSLYEKFMYQLTYAT